jgi:hypothetical protein
MQAQDVIKRMFRILGVIASGEAGDANEFDDALSVLNSLLAEWRGKNINLPDYTIEALTTEVNLPLSDKEAVAYQLAKRMAPEFGVSLGPEALEAAADSWQALQHRYFVAGHTDFSELPNAAGGYWYDIRTG